MEKFWRWLGVESEVVREELIEIPAPQEETRSSSPNVVSIHTNKTLKVVVCEPESFDEVQMLADHLKNRKQIILNMENTPPDISQRIIDFISGTTYSLEGHSQQLGKNIFIFTPSNVEIARDQKSIIKKNSFVNPFGGER